MAPDGTPNIGKPEEQAVTDLNGHFKKRISALLETVTSPDIQAHQSYQRMRTAVEKSADYSALQHSLTQHLKILSDDLELNQDLDLLRFKWKVEQFVHALVEQELATLRQEQLVFDRRKITKASYKDKFTDLLYIYYNAYWQNQPGQKEADKQAQRAFFLNGLEFIYDIRDENGKKLQLTETLGLQFRTEKNAQEKFDALKQQLNNLRARRLSLKYPREIVPERDLENRTDEENGYLCVHDQFKGGWRKVTFEEITGWLGLGQVSSRLQELIDHPANTLLRRSDVTHMHYDKRPLGQNNNSPLIDKIRYRFPPTINLDEDTTLPVNETSTHFVNLSPDYAAIEVRHGPHTSIQLLEKLKPSALTDQQRQAITRYNLAEAGQEQTRNLLTDYDVTMFLPPHAKETPEQYARRVMRTASLNDLINLYKSIYDRSGFELQSQPLKQQLLFASFYFSRSRSEQQTINQVLKQSGELFFKTFVACERDLEAGNDIMEIAGRFGDRAKEVFLRFEELLRLQPTDAAPVTAEETEYYTVILRRAAAFIQAVARLPKGSKIEEFLEKEDRFRPETVRAGASFAAKTQYTKEEVRPIEEINSLLSDMHIDIIEAGPQKLIKDPSPEAMQNPNNYLQPEMFGPADFQFLCREFHNTYSRIAPDAIKFLINHVGEDLLDPTVKFITIRDRQKNLRAIIKYKPDRQKKKEYYFGTMMIDQGYQRDFRLGDTIQKLAESKLPEGYTWWGEVLSRNPALERHIETGGAVADWLTPLEIETGVSTGALLNIHFMQRERFTTKNPRKFSRSEVKRLCAANEANLRKLAGLTANFYRIPALPAGEEEMLRICQNNFQQGMFLTRFFQDKKRKDSTGWLYLVFERPST